MDLIQFVIQILMIPFAFVVGGFSERKHFRSLEEREAQLTNIRVMNLKRVVQPETVATSTMIVGQVVIASDHYKSFATKIRGFIGGEMKNAEKLMSRARREALIRVKEQARELGCDELWNIRFCFSNINAMSQGGGAMQVELLAYATAVIRDA